MTREEYIKQASKEDLAQTLCNLIQDYGWMLEEVAEGNAVFPHTCTACPAKGGCKPGNNGFIDWLEEEEEE